MPSKIELPLYPDFEQLLSNLNDEGVDYLLIGGYAVMVHAQPRGTKDLDILIRCDAENASATWRALAKFGAPLEGVTADYFAEPGNGYRMGEPPIMVEILTQIDGIDFATARANAATEIVNDAGLQAPIISAADLITNKLAAGRSQDIADVEAIRQAQEQKRARAIDGDKPEPKRIVDPTLTRERFVDDPDLTREVDGEPDLSPGRRR
ncbi:hypothetical protein [Acidisphaera sp. S103]|uniref:hypothetical protein n=1 Tax=Acidisphaera sp. S103 TaxID=1747223 RepID=UPI001C2065E9|nr:hypothetical protein [Acidisphaera sp. S103]